MEREKHLPIEEMELFRRYVEVADWAWDLVSEWPPLAADTVGKQLIRACDSVGANLVEGDGRYADADALHYFIIARGSAREARYWLRRAMRRDLLTDTIGEQKIAELTSATQLLNRLIAYRRKRRRADRVQESSTEYQAATHDPFVGETGP